ncbi:MAG: hypothetical protein KDB00_07905 [Planctomycetales bacterium]|nr:hypothetical protein [Planctomycetales bacterium]
MTFSVWINARKLPGDGGKQVCQTYVEAAISNHSLANLLAIADQESCDVVNAGRQVDGAGLN